MVAIRADANHEISIGHIMRCLSIADELRIQGEIVVFIISSPDAQSIINKRGYQVICLNNNYKKKDAEVNKLIDELNRIHADSMVLDSYEVTKGYMERLKKAVCTVYIDDIMKFDYAADMIINYSVDASITNYSRCKCNKFLLGSRYTPIRREFRYAKSDSSENIKHLFVSAGGSDHYDMAYRIAESFINGDISSDTIILDIVVGRFYGDVDRLKYLDKGRGMIRVHSNIDNIWELMSKAFLAISASGTTIAELLSLGIPVLNYITADNQKNGADSLKNHNAVVYAGNVEDGVDEVVNNIISYATKFLKGDLCAEFYKNKGKEIYDGYGSERIALELLNIMKERQSKGC